MAFVPRGEDRGGAWNLSDCFYRVQNISRCAENHPSRMDKKYGHTKNRYAS